VCFHALATHPTDTPCPVQWFKTALDVATNDLVKAALRQHGARHSLFYAVEIIDFEWAEFSPRDKAVAGMDVVLCAPEQADADIENADQLVGKIAVVYGGGGYHHPWQQKTERLIAAGAHGVIIINTEDNLIQPKYQADTLYEAAIPVVMIKAKDATALLASGNSSCLGKPRVGMLEVVADLIKEGADVSERNQVSLYRVLCVALVFSVWFRLRHKCVHSLVDLEIHTHTGVLAHAHKYRNVFVCMHAHVYAPTDTPARRNNSSRLFAHDSLDEQNVCMRFT